METFDAITIEMDFNAGSWTDVTADILSGSKPRWRRGIISNSPIIRVGNIGTFTFRLKNTDGTYSPGHASAQSGFGIGNLVRLSFELENETYYKFYGRIPRNGIKVVPGIYGPRYTEITANDWMWLVSEHELRLLAVDTSKRADEALTTIDGNFTIAPLVTSYETGNVTFPAIFNTLRDKTTALSEIGKIVDSELGFYYVIGDRTGGETVKLEGRYTRANTTSPTDISKTSAESGFRLAEDGTYLLDESGDKRIWNETQAADFDGIMTSMEVSEGKFLSNLIKTQAQPISVDAAATTVLFSMDEVLEIGAGETKQNIRSAYTDPSGAGRKVSGQEMVTPVATTDYTANAEEGGGGADKTAQLSVTGPDGTGNVTFGAEAAEYGLVNSDTAAIYVTKLQFRGKGIYDYRPVEFVAEDTTSQAAYGVIPNTVKFIYEPDVLVVQSYGEVLLSQLKDPHRTVDRVTFSANRNSMTMYGFLQLEPGTRFTHTESQAAIDDDYFVNGYEAEIIEGKYVNYTLICSEAGTQTYWILGQSKLGQDTGLAIG